MTSEHRQPGLAYWATVVVAGLIVLAAYPLSVGPAEWLRHHGWIPESLWDAIGTFYAPLGWLYANGPQSVRDVMDWYGHLWF
jgi:hypothetical protein